MGVVKHFTYRLPDQRVVFGNGVLDRLAEEADARGITRALVVSSPGRAEMAARAARILGPACVGVSDAATLNVPARAVDAAKAAASEAAADGLIVLGGGSAVGLGKALAVESGMPWIAVVTTYSGSEMSDNWTVVHADGPIAGRDPSALAGTVLYDPELTLDIPPHFSAASGMNAMAHAVESLYGAAANPVTDSMAAEAVRTIGVALPRVCAEPGDLAHRNAMLYGAWLAATFRGGLAISHRIAQSMRKAFNLIHAETHAAVLPHAVAFNQGAAPFAMRAIENSLGADNAAAALYDLNAALALKTGFKDLGVKDWDVDKAAAVVLAQPFHNPRAPKLEDVRRLLEDIYEGGRP